ncbi:transposable element Tcb1 transposase [Elysia marginata]|uniref:Transposable element Tcb1 transposase n=1 Tax=Elysia marginata TaxID=1093978 RepID=A0AAV4EZC0_9GAST|nr:transposable element Tcb1 transposase [Elysia marginata]
MTFLILAPTHALMKGWRVDFLCVLSSDTSEHEFKHTPESRAWFASQGLRARRPYIGPILTQLHRHLRTLWAPEHEAWDRIQWQSVVFGDEFRFCIDHADGRVRTYILVYGEEAVKDTKQIALGNTTGGVEHL